MSIERYLRLIAGSLVLLSVALGHWVNPNWSITSPASSASTCSSPPLPTGAR